MLAYCMPGSCTVPAPNPGPTSPTHRRQASTQHFFALPAVLLERPRLADQSGCAAAVAAGVTTTAPTANQSYIKFKRAAHSSPLCGGSHPAASEPPDSQPALTESCASTPAHPHHSGPRHHPRRHPRRPAAPRCRPAACLRYSRYSRRRRWRRHVPSCSPAPPLPAGLPRLLRAAAGVHSCWQTQPVAWHLDPVLTSSQTVGEWQGKRRAAGEISMRVGAANFKYEEKCGSRKCTDRGTEQERIESAKAQVRSGAANT